MNRIRRLRMLFRGVSRRFERSTSSIDLAAREVCPASIVAALVAISGCASTPYEPKPESIVALTARAEVREMGAVRVRVSVPSPEETREIFGLALYDRNVQPVWIEVDNGGPTDLRYAPVGTDPDYVPPFEVAYTHKEGFSSAAYDAIEEYLFGHSMPRTVAAGELRSGFVFTQFRPGTKGVNVDLFGPEADDAYSFVFFVNVPGFVADHAEVSFESLYQPGAIRTYDLAGLRGVLASLPCCSSDRAGVREGDPVNVVFVGDGDDVLQALLRAGWFERFAGERDMGTPVEAAYLYGRPADAVFRKDRPGLVARSELRLWMAPLEVGDQPVWLGDVIHFLPDSEGRPVALDPDIDDAREYFLQDLWYSQGLAQFAWLRSGNAVPIDQPKRDVMGQQYFTDGYRVVIWPSGTPVSMLETEYAAWDEPPAR